MAIGDRQEHTTTIDTVRRTLTSCQLVRKGLTRHLLHEVRQIIQHSPEKALSAGYPVKPFEENGFVENKLGKKRSGSEQLAMPI